MERISGKSLAVSASPVSKRVNWLEIAILCGLLCPLVALASIWVAISYAPWFSWTVNSLSDLAGLTGEKPIWAARGIAGVTFNSSLIIDGILAYLFAITMGNDPQLVKGIGRLGRLAFVLGACALAGAGIFTKTMGQIHCVFSVSFFLLIPISMLLIGIAVIKSLNKLLGCITIALGLAGIAPLFIPWPWEGEAIPDMISIFAMTAFVFIFSIKLLKQARVQSVQKLPKETKRVPCWV